MEKKLIITIADEGFALDNPDKLRTHEIIGICEVLRVQLLNQEAEWARKFKVKQEVDEAIKNSEINSISPKEG